MTPKNLCECGKERCELSSGLGSGSCLTFKHKFHCQSWNCGHPLPDPSAEERYGWVKNCPDVSLWSLDGQNFVNGLLDAAVLAERQRVWRKALEVVPEVVPSEVALQGDDYADFGTGWKYSHTSLLRTSESEGVTVG